ncbi:hypothetical protein BDV96DRAFT_595585 [Lophiotrema nucula]|uniref:Uncharacterized protein n=1 Tax=Lophiotrema nucula TaxID=690887 RepID=A0A6A5ZK00_9PLEO|nr:hypothetical protein BDV96DRAFT_595585 [Lophiotrema nucula]
MSIMNTKRSAQAVEAHIVTVVKKTKGDDGTPISTTANMEQSPPPPTTSTDTTSSITTQRKKVVAKSLKARPLFSERAEFCILTHDNYNASGTDGHSTTYGTRTFPEVLKLYNERFNATATSTEAVRKQCTAALRERYCSLHPEYPRNITYAKRPPSAPKQAKSGRSTTAPAITPLRLTESQKLADLEQLSAKLKEIMDVAVNDEILCLAEHNLAWVETKMGEIKADINGNYGCMRVPAAIRKAADIKYYFTYGTEDEVDGELAELEGDEEQTMNVGFEIEDALESDGDKSSSDDEESD